MPRCPEEVYENCGWKARARQLEAALEAAHANVQAALDPATDGHLGLVMSAESILSHALKDD